MNYTDRTLVELADPATRSGPFDQTALEQIVSAGYDVDALGITGPFTALFDDFRLAVAAEAEGVLDGAFAPVSGEGATQATFRLTGLPEQQPLRIDALWRGAIVARYRVGGEPITDVTSNWPDPGAIDTAVKAAHGGVLPADPVALESARHAALLAELQAGLDQPASLDDAGLDAMLAEAGAESVGDLLAHPGTAELGTLSVTFAAPANVAQAAKRLPVAGALLVRDVGFSVADLLAESSLVRERLTRLGAGLPSGNGLRPLRQLLVIWIVPASVFADADWPGTTADLRRAKAGAWLAQAGIGLVATT